MNRSGHAYSLSSHLIVWNGASFCPKTRCFLSTCFCPLACPNPHSYSVSTVDSPSTWILYFIESFGHRKNIGKKYDAGKLAKTLYIWGYLYNTIKSLGHNSPSVKTLKSFFIALWDVYFYRGEIWHLLDLTSLKMSFLLPGCWKNSLISKFNSVLLCFVHDMILILFEAFFTMPSTPKPVLCVIWDSFSSSTY